MKKIFSNLAWAGAITTALLLPTSCSDDVMGSKEGDGNVIFSVELPAEFGHGTRAFGDGLKAENLTYAVYEQMADGSRRLVEKSEHEIKFENLRARVPLTLIKGRTYDIVFWADHPDNEDEHFYTFNAETMNIEINYDNVVQNAENRDAFFAQKRDFEVTGNYSQTVTLRRPFAQIDFGTRDLNEDAVINWLPNLQTRLTTKGATKLNLLDGTVSDEQTIVYELAAPPVGEIFPHQDPNADLDGTVDNKPVMQYEYLSMDYLLVPDLTGDGTDEKLVDIKYEIYNGTDKINEFPVSNVPVRRNYQTCIFGRLLTSTTEFNVVIDENFIPPHYDYTFLDWNEFAIEVARAESGSILKLEHDLYFGTSYTEYVNGKQVCHDDRDAILNIPVGKSLTIDLNGHNMYNAAIQVYGELSIIGDGVVKGQVHQEEGTYAWNPVLGVMKSKYSADGGKLSINGGHYIAPMLNPSTPSAVLFDGPDYKGTVTVYSGTFESYEVDGRWHNFPADGGSNATNVVFHGGTYIGCDPRPAGGSTNFIHSTAADGRNVWTYKGDEYTKIMSTGGEVTISNDMDVLDLSLGASRTAPLTVNLEGKVNKLVLGDFKGMTTVILKNDQLIGHKQIVISGDALSNFTLKGGNGNNQVQVFNSGGGQLDWTGKTINNVTFANLTNLSAIDYSEGSVNNLTYENVKIFGEGVPVIKMTNMKAAGNINIGSSSVPETWFGHFSSADADQKSYLILLDGLTGNVNIDNVCIYNYAGGGIYIRTAGNVNVNRVRNFLNAETVGTPIMINGSKGMPSVSVTNCEIKGKSTANRLYILDPKDNCNINVQHNTIYLNDEAITAAANPSEQAYGINISRSNGTQIVADANNIVANTQIFNDWNGDWLYRAKVDIQGLNMNNPEDVTWPYRDSH